MPSKPPPYTGILEKPKIVKLPITAIGVDPECPPEIWTQAGLKTDVWRKLILRTLEEAEEERQLRFGAFLERIAALCDHLGVDRRSPGWARDLAINLIVRHEPDTVADGIKLARICEREGISFAAPEADYRLAVRLAELHVPGFHIEYVDENKDLWSSTRLHPTDVATLVIAFAAAGSHLSRGVGKPSDRELVRLILDKKSFLKIVGKETADAIHETLNSLGNKKRWHSHPISERTLRSYLHQLRKALASYVQGEATEFQRHVLFTVLPLLVQHDRSAVGQVRSADGSDQ